MLYTGICGSDIHYWQHGRIGSFIVKSPIVLGHESSGIVHSIGPAVTSLKVGDRVALEPGVSCGVCLRCKEGRYNLCPDMVFAATPPNDGTLCKYYALPADLCYKLPDNVSTKSGAVVEPLAVAVHITVRQGGVKQGDNVVIFGAGPVGLLCCAVARTYGARTVVVVDINQQRVNFAINYAATRGIIAENGKDVEQVAKDMIEECELGRGADVAIDASGAERSIQTAIHVLRPGGTFVQGGMGKPDIQFPITAMCTKELNVKGSFRYGPGDYDLAIQLLGTGKVSVKDLMTHQFAFADAEKAFEVVKAADGIKVIIEGPSDVAHDI